MNLRSFAPPDADAIKVEQRQARLPASVQSLIEQASAAIANGDVQRAAHALQLADAQAPQQPDILRMTGMLHVMTGDFPSADGAFRRALQIDPADALSYFHYARAREMAGDMQDALALRKQAVERIPDSPLAWYDLGDHRFQIGEMREALDSLQRALILAPDYALAHLKLGSALVYSGRIEEGATAYRRTLAFEPTFGGAWYSLANIKTQQFSPSEVLRMRELVAQRELPEIDRVLVQFSLAKACEDLACYDEAYALLMEANARWRPQVNWSAARFSEQVRRAEELFGEPSSLTDDPGFGAEVIFIVGLPRSGTTLTEQILASHSRVEGANELGDLGRILGEESARRRQHYPEWVVQAQPADWRRLGQDYLDCTARWRETRPIFTDKMPSNWLFIGAIRSMLPGARIVVCRREPVENCWSCFKQFFLSGWDFTFSLEELAAYWKDFDRTAAQWSKRAPEHVLEQSYERLVADPELRIRALLDFCGLPFEEACLRFHEAKRTVRTASAGQVRQPLQKNTARAENYGALLDPLRAALGLQAFAATRAAAGVKQT